MPIDPNEIEIVVTEYAEMYPALINFLQAAEIAHATLQSIYDASSRGDFDGLKISRGKKRLLMRDAFVRHLLARSA